MNAKQRRQQREAKQPAEILAATPVALKVGDHQFPAFTRLSAAFGAEASDYPQYEAIPVEFRRGHTPFNKAVSSLFFTGGKLADHGLKLKSDIDEASAYTAIRALLCSFAPKHEVKEATVAWALSEWTEPTRPAV